MKYVVTGTQGFIGNNLDRELRTEHNILPITEKIFQNIEWKTILLNKLDKFKPDGVFHVGACSNTLETDVQYIMTVNYEFTKVLMDWCLINQCPIIYSSSAANYGEKGYHPSNLYGWSKYTAEGYITSNGGISLRYFNVYGFGEHNKGKMASIIYQIINHTKTKTDKFKLFPNKPLRDFVYIKDIISANLYGMKHYQTLLSKTYDVGFGVAEPFEKILEILNLEYEYHNLSQIPIGYQFYTCSDKSKWIPNWSPSYNLVEGIKDYLNILQKDE